jgi:hypothetical protein
MPVEDAYAEAAGEKQSSFEYKQYKDQNQYKNALDQRMHRVWSAIGDAIDDAGTIPIPGLINTYTKTEGKISESSNFVPQGVCLADRYILVTAYHAKKQQRSVIYAVDKENKSLVSTLTVPNKYHLGGIAFDGSNIWLTGDTSDKYEGEPFVQYIRYEDFSRMINEPVYEIGKDEISAPVYIKNKPSFLECDNGILWVGTYIGRESSKKGIINGYKINKKENGPELNTFMYSVITGIDSSAQGIDIKNNYLYVSSSYAGGIGSVRSSFVTKYNIKEIKNGNGDINVSGKELKRVEVPKMNEEIIVANGRILINFEAAADCWISTVIATDRLLSVSDSIWR